jgi:rare lipoprotein A
MSTVLTPLLARWLTAGAAALQFACSAPQEKKPAASPAALRPSGPAQHGIASIYTDRRTASGEPYSRHAMAAAHKHLPMGCRCKVTNLTNGKSCIVRINDRGPYIRGRIIDLTPAAAAKIGLGYKQGLARVRVERL